MLAFLEATGVDCSPTIYKYIKHEKKSCTAEVLRNEKKSIWFLNFFAINGSTEPWRVPCVGRISGSSFKWNQISSQVFKLEEIQRFDLVPYPSLLAKTQNETEFNLIQERNFLFNPTDDGS